MKIKIVIRHNPISYYRYVFGFRYLIFWFDKNRKIRYEYFADNKLEKDSRDLPENKRFFTRFEKYIKG